MNANTSIIRLVSDIKTPYGTADVVIENKSGQWLGVDLGNGDFDYLQDNGEYVSANEYAIVVTTTEYNTDVEVEGIQLRLFVNSRNGRTVSIKVDPSQDSEFEAPQDNDLGEVDLGYEILKSDEEYSIAIPMSLIVEAKYYIEEYKSLPEHGDE